MMFVCHGVVAQDELSSNRKSMGRGWRELPFMFSSF